MLHINEPSSPNLAEVCVGWCIFLLLFVYFKRERFADLRVLLVQGPC